MSAANQQPEREPGNLLADSQAEAAPDEPRLVAGSRARFPVRSKCAEFNYAREFKTLDVEALQRDVVYVMTTSQRGVTTHGVAPKERPD
jgi:catalase (peroxidase I)